MAIQDIIANDFNARTETANSISDNYGNPAYSKIIFLNTVEFTAEPLGSGAFYLETVCGTGKLNIAITEFKLYSGNTETKASMIILQGTAGTFYCMGDSEINSTGINDKELKFHSSNSLNGVYPAAERGIIITVNNESGVYSLKYSKDGENQKSYTMQSGSLDETGIKEYLFN